MAAPKTADVFDSAELRHVLGAFVTGVTVITTLDAYGRPHGLTVNSFSSVSLDPPLVLWSQSGSAPSHPVFRDAERFAVNILAEDQIDISGRFARGGADKFSGCAVHPGVAGLPLIDRCAAYLECRKVGSYPGGDHTVFIGQVERIARSPRQPLAFGSGRYLMTQAHEMAGAPAVSAALQLERLRGVRLATQALATLSKELDETLGLGVFANRGPTMVRWEAARQPVSVNLQTGLVLPLLGSATGLAFAAWLPREQTQAFIDAELAMPLPSGDPPMALDSVLAEVRTDGVARMLATSRFEALYGERIHALSVPVFDAAGRMVLALTTIGAVGRLDVSVEGRVASALKVSAASLSGHLGHRPLAASH